MPRSLSALVITLVIGCAGPQPGAITAAGTAARLGETRTIAQLARWS